jgi:Tol biopolymer transport system component
MSNLKPFILACLAGMLVSGGLLSASCSATTAYKPSGLPELIAFTSDRDKVGRIYTVKPDGTDAQATSSDNRTNDGLPGWSPDGAKMAFSSNQSGKYEIWTMNSDGSDRRRLTDLKSFSFMPKWSPDGAKIAFVSQITPAGGSRSVEIFAMNSDGSGLQQLTESIDLEAAGGQAGGHDHAAEITGWNSVPAWSPDGAKILFGSNRDGDGSIPVIYIMNADGSNQRKFGLFADVDGSQPDWSWATNKIVFVRGSAAKGDIWVMDGGSPFPLLTAKKLTDNIDNNGNPAWSPDGRQIAYVCDANSNTDIYIMNADGSNARRLTYEKSAEGYPAWRP